MYFVYLDKNWIRGEYHDFKDEGRVGPGRTTHKFVVYDRRSGNLLGHVKWFAPWRQYIFFGLNTMLMAKMHRELADFIEWRTQAHKLKSKEQ